MNDYSFKQKIIEGGLWLSGSAFLVRLLGLVTTILILRTLSVEEYGMYQLALAAFGFLAAFLIGGFDSLIVNDLARERGEERFDRVKKLFFEYGRFKIFIGAALFLIAFAGAEFLGRWYSGEIASLVRIMSFLFLFIVTERLQFFLLNLNLKFRAMSLFTLAEELAKLGLTLLLVLYWGWGVVGLVYAYTFSTAVALVIFSPYTLYLLKSLLKYSASPDRVLLLLVSRHGKWGLLNRYLADTQKYVRPWLIGAFAGVGSVGLYSLAEGIYSQLVSLVPLSNLLAPLVPQEIKNEARMRAIVLYGVKYGTVIFILLGVAAFLFIPYLVEWFFPKYLPALPLFYVMLLALLTTASANVVNTILFSYYEQKLLFILTLIRLVFSVAAVTLLLWAFGVMGAAIEFVLTAVFFVAIRYISLKRVAPRLFFSPKEIFTFSRADYEMFKSLLRFRR